MKGQLLSDRYQVLDVLGSGGMGQTYIAEDTQLPGNPKCAVKQLKPINNDPNFLVTASRLFTSEAEILQQLGKHDRIPQLLAYFERDGEFFLVQEFIDGQPLSAELPLGQRLPESEVVALLEEVLGILEFIHGQGVIHRDIKPDNLIRRQQDGKLVLIDFGAVKQVRVQQATAVGQVSMTVAIGTPGYMPTEQSSGKPRPSSDIYALGMVGIQALTGLLPSQLREDEDGEVVWQEQAEVSDGLAAVLTKMTRHYFKFRYQSASEVLQALKDLASVSANGSYTPTQVVSNNLYTPTEVAAESSSTQSNSNEPTHTSEPKPPSPQPLPPNPPTPAPQPPKPRRAWIGIGALITVIGALSAGGIYVAPYFRAKADFQSIEKLKSSGNWEECINETSNFLDNLPDRYRVSQLSTDSVFLSGECHLQFAKQKADRKDWSAAFEQLNLIPEGTPAFSQKHQYLEDWSKAILQSARQDAARENHQSAIDKIQLIPAVSSSSGQAQELIAELGDNVFDRAQTIYEEQGIDAAKEILDGIASNPRLESQVRETIRQWEQEDAENQKNFEEAQAALDNWDWWTAWDKSQQLTTQSWQEKAQSIQEQANTKIAEFEEAERQRIAAEEAERQRIAAEEAERQRIADEEAQAEEEKSKDGETDGTWHTCINGWVEGCKGDFHQYNPETGEFKWLEGYSDS